MRTLVLTITALLILSAAVSYFFEASFAVAPGVVVIAILVGQIVHLGSIPYTVFCINLAILVSVLAALLILSHFFPVLTEVGLYNVQSR